LAFRSNLEAERPRRPPPRSPGRAEVCIKVGAKWQILVHISHAFHHVLPYVFGPKVRISARRNPPRSRSQPPQTL